MCSVERVHASDFDAFLATLAELRGDFIQKVSAAVSHSISDILNKRDVQSRYRFENVDAGVLTAYQLDALVLVDLCGTD